MKDPELFEIEQAAPAGRHFAVHGGVKAAMFAQEAAERAHQRHIADNVDHFAVDGGGFAGEIVMQRPARRSQPEHDQDHNPGDHH